ncbi:MAG: NAD-dependent epimerase/dehydratase family protein [Anaerolineae bacterium]
MAVLVLGGTQFIGRHITQALLAAGHEVTLFHRGRTNPDLFYVPQLTGDRDDQVGEGRNALRDSGQTWDACIDISGYVPRHVRDSAVLLADRVGYYVFISTISVYARPFQRGYTEAAPLQPIEHPESEAVGEHYGELKVICENEVRAAFGERAALLRLGLVCGPWDHTDRVTYWVMRAAQGGRMLVPAAPDDPFQTVDARDIAAFTTHILGAQPHGPVNVVAPPVTWREWLAACAAVTDAASEPVWVDDERWLHDHTPQDTRPRGALPMFIPEENGPAWTADNSRSVQWGAAYRPVADSVRAIHTWRTGQPDPLAAGLSPAQERAMLSAWGDRQ